MPATPETPMRVVVVDDHDGFRAALRGMLHAQPDLEVIGEAVDGMTAVVVCALSDPDVVVMDLRLPHMDGVAATERIRSLCPSTRVVACTASADAPLAQRARAAGAVTLIFKDARPDELIEAVRAASATS
jgi:DNA-binding NarL/FixJ family response regulator